MINLHVSVNTGASRSRKMGFQSFYKGTIIINNMKLLFLNLLNSTTNEQNLRWDLYKSSSYQAKSNIPIPKRKIKLTTQMPLPQVFCTVQWDRATRQIFALPIDNCFKPGCLCKPLVTDGISGLSASMTFLCEALVYSFKIVSNAVYKILSFDMLIMNIENCVDKIYDGFWIFCVGVITTLRPWI